jgi:hypothetical protein
VCWLSNRLRTDPAQLANVVPLGQLATDLATAQTFSAPTTARSAAVIRGRNSPLSGAFRMNSITGTVTFQPRTSTSVYKPGKRWMSWAPTQRTWSSVARSQHSTWPSSTGTCRTPLVTSLLLSLTFPTPACWRKPRSAAKSDNSRPSAATPHLPPGDGTGTAPGSRSPASAQEARYGEGVSRQHRSGALPAGITNRVGRCRRTLVAPAHLRRAGHLYLSRRCRPLRPFPPRGHHRSVRVRFSSRWAGRRSSRPGPPRRPGSLLASAAGKAAAGRRTRRRPRAAWWSSTRKSA